ncbi:DUF3218 family protein, partial [Pseudomonas aeruginosa]|nr:DUF3218 family protein [Pseudomonas aeruginosa]
HCCTARPSPGISCPGQGWGLKLMTLGVGLRLDAPNFSDVFNTIKSGLRYTTAVALLLAYFAAI